MVCTRSKMYEMGASRSTVGHRGDRRWVRRLDQCERETQGGVRAVREILRGREASERDQGREG